MQHRWLPTGGDDNTEGQGGNGVFDERCKMNNDMFGRMDDGIPVDNGYLLSLAYCVS